MSLDTAALRLVAAREVRERWRARSFRVGLLISAAGAAAMVVVPKVVAGPTSPVAVGVVGHLTPSARAGIGALEPVVGRPVIVADEPDAATAVRLVRAKTLALALIDGARIVVRRAPGRDDTSSTARLVASVQAVLREDSGLRAAGLGDAGVQLVAAAQPPTVIGLTSGHRTRSRGRSATLGGVMILYAFLSAYGAWVLYGVVEEKSSRVAEVLLASVGPTELLLGKVIGIGVMAIAQGAATAGTAFVAATATGSHALDGPVRWTVVEMVGWFLVGYAFYCCLYAAAGSLVSRQEQVQNVAFPLSVPLLIAYVFSIFSLFSDEASSTVKVLSLLPPTAPIAMPVRIALGGTPVWQVVGSVVVLALSTVVVARATVVVYRRALLRTGRRLTWREMLASPAA